MLLTAGLGLVIGSLGLPSTAAAQDVDVTPPALVDFSFAPAAIDVSAGPQTVVATLHVTDDLAGVSSVNVSFRSPTGAQFQFSSSSSPAAGTRTDGTFVVNVVFPQFAAAGTWTVSSVTLSDLAGNFSSLNTIVLQSRGLPTTLEVTSLPDTEPPVLTALAITPAVVNVSTGDAMVTVDLQVTDNLSGTAFAPCVPGSFFAFFAVTLRSPSGVQERFMAAAALGLTSGTRADGTWSGTLTMPRQSEAGPWSVQSLTLRDCAGNSRFYSASMLQTLGHQASVDVVSDPADTQPPALTSLTYLPITINTSAGFQFVTVRLGITDNLSGTKFSPTTPQLSFFEAGVQFRSPSGNQVRSAAFFSPFTLVSGTVLDGIWESSVFFPRFSEDGTWRIDLLQIKDAVRNVRAYNTGDLQALGLATTLEVVRPSQVSDGTAGPGGGTVEDDTFGARASVSFPAGALDEDTDVAIDVFLEPLDIPSPTGFSGPGTLFVNIELTPAPRFPLPAPGMTVVLPLPNPMPAGAVLSLFKVDTVTGNLVPAIDVLGMNATGTVNLDGQSATFSGVASLSIVVGLVPESISVAIDIKPGSDVNPVKLGSRGVTPVAILSSPLFDARTVSPETVTLAGAGARRHSDGRPMHSFSDVNGDGRLDMVLQIETQHLVLASESIEAVLHGATTGGIPVVGRDAIRVVP